MGSITIQIVGDASVGTRTKTYAVSDADINRLVAWAVAAYTDAGSAPPTPVQALAKWADRFIAQTKESVVGLEQRNALAAVAPPPPFVAT